MKFELIYIDSAKFEAPLSTIHSLTQALLKAGYSKSKQGVFDAYWAPAYGEGSDNG